MASESSHSYGQPGHGPPNGPQGSGEEVLKTERVQIERKTFVLSLRQNVRGRFLKITEDVGGRRDTIIIPSTGLTDFQRVLDEMVRADDGD